LLYPRFNLGRQRSSNEKVRITPSRKVKGTPKVGQWRASPEGNAGLTGQNQGREKREQGEESGERETAREKR